jgi:hypothetical protein
MDKLSANFLLLSISLTLFNAAPTFAQTSSAKATNPKHAYPVASPEEIQKAEEF